MATLVSWATLEETHNCVPQLMYSLKVREKSVKSQGILKRILSGNSGNSDFICDSEKLPFPSHLGKYIIKNGKIRTKIHEIGKIKAFFGFGMTPM